MVSKYYPRMGETLYTHTLDNGLAIQVIPKKGFQKSYAMFATNYGGADRRFRYQGEWLNTPAGVAHFLEHKMFDMPDGSNALSVLSANGASPNAFTSSAMTAYYFECTEGFQENLKMLLEFVSTPYFTEESVAKEQGIIGQEIRMCEDSPDYALYYNLLKCLYARNPVRDSVAGTVESIREITPDVLYACHKVFYHPSNMRLCCVGDVEPEAVCALAEQVLPKGKGEVPARDYGSAEPGKPASFRHKAAMEVSNTQFLFGAKLTPAKPGPDRLRQVLTGDLALRYLMGESSPLYTSLYAKNLIHTDFSAELDYAAGAAMLIAGGEGRDPHSVLAAVEEALSELRRDIDTEAFQRIRRTTLGYCIRSMDRLGGLCTSLAEAGFAGYCPLDAPEMLENITPEEVRQALLDWLQPERIALSVIEPLRP